MHGLRGLPLGWLLIGLLLVVSFLSSASGQVVTGAESVGFTVSDLDRAERFFTSVLQFEKVSDKELWGRDVELLTGVFGARIRVARFRLGDETIELTEYLTPGGRPVPADSRSNDRWFQHIAIIVRDMDEAYAVLRKHKVKHASTGPQTLPEYITNAAGIRAFYFKDPDDHVLEILEFPPDKGDAKWRARAAGGELFLGIDHTAIVVGDTETSLGFYRDALGLEVAGSSMNFGTEQEHLNNVFGARLMITGLRTPEAGIAVEFLEYLAPADGRPFPADTRSNDLWHWQTSFAVPDADTSSRIPGLRRSMTVSSGPVTLDPDKFGFASALIVRDPDGHAVRLVSR
ncbi:MAG: VOC family protein [Acidobacteriota bacterium]|nr:MAG: VOC family protein [Acidobacteriota bacterium]